MDSEKHKKVLLPVIGLIVIICLFAVAGCRKKAELVLPTAESSAEDEKIVRQLANEVTATFRLENPTPITKLEEIFADDFCQRTMEGKIIRGKQDNLFYYGSSQKKAQKIFRSRTVQYDIQSVRMSRDLAVVFGEVKGYKWFKNAPAPSAGNFLETLVFKKNDGKWYLVEEQSIVPEPPKPPVQPAQQEKAAEPNISSPNDAPKIQNLSVEQAKNLDEYIRGSFSGIGVDIETNPNGIYIKKVIPESPANKAGLQNGQTITAIDGQSAVGMSLQKAVSLIKGPQGTSVNLKILSADGTVRDISVVRGTVITSGVDTNIVEPNIGLLAISGFNKETAREVRQALMNFQQQNIKGLVLDLRGNRGGYLPAVNEVASMFAGPNEVMWQMRYIGQREYLPERGTGEKMVLQPVVVLIDSNTICGGELLASAVKLKAGGRLLGQKTFGEGTFGKLESQADGSSQRVTTGYFYTSDGKDIDKQGISPDKELDANLPNDEVLKQAVDELKKEIENRK